VSKLWAATAAIVVCLALGGVPVLAQEEGTPPFREAVVVEGEQVDCTFASYDRWLEDGLIYAQATELVCTGNYSDPRLNGTWKIAGWYDGCFTTTGEVYGPATCIYWSSSSVMTDDDGTWSGSETCLDVSQGPQARRCMGIYEGGGAYEGLTYVESYETDLTTFENSDAHGIIYEGPPPPWEVPSPPSD
jgi:hypothetical protein